MNRRRVIGLITLILMVLTIPVFVVAVRHRQDLRSRAAPATALAISPASITVQTGEPFSLDVMIDTGENTVSAAELIITFDGSKLQAQSITAGDFLTTVLVPGATDESTATITLGSPPTAPKKGTGQLARVTFKASGTAGSSPIRFGNGTQVAGIGEQGNVLVGTTPGNVTIAGVVPTATLVPTLPPEVTPTATPTLSLGVTLSPTPTGTFPQESTPTPLPTQTPRAGGTSTAPTVTDPADGAVVTTNQPTIKGKGAPGSSITIVIHSPDPLTAVVTADAGGNWSYTPDTLLADGSHTLTVTQRLASGTVQTTTSTFTVQTQPLPISGNTSPTLVLVLVATAMLVLGFWAATRRVYVQR